MTCLRPCSSVVGPLLVTFCLAVAIPAKAQQPAEVFGVTIGLNASTLTQSPLLADGGDTNRRLGIVGGGYGVWHLYEHLKLQGEALLSLKGAETDTSKVRITYLEVPILARWNFRAWNGRTPFALGGPALAFKLDASASQAGSSRDVGSEIENFDLGWVLGAGLDFDQFVVDARYTWGILNVPRGNPADADRIRNGAFSVLVSLPLRR